VIKIVLSWPYFHRIQHTAYSLLMSVFSRHSPTPWKISNLPSNPPEFTRSTPKKYYLRSEEGPLHQYPVIANRRGQHQCLYGALGAQSRRLGGSIKSLIPKSASLLHKATESLLFEMKFSNTTSARHCALRKNAENEESQWVLSTKITQEKPSSSPH